MEFKILRSGAMATLMLGSLSFAQTTPTTPDMTGNTTVTTPATPSNESTPTATLTDSQVLQVLMTSNDVELDSAKMVRRKTDNKEVKALADHIIKDHRDSNTKARALGRKLNVRAEASDVSKSIDRDANTYLDQLRKQSGENLDRTYIFHEVSFHEATLSSIDKTLIPNAKSEDLKELLRNTRPVIIAHLEHARKIQATMSGAKDAPANNHASPAIEARDKGISPTNSNDNLRSPTGEPSDALNKTGSDVVQDPIRDTEKSRPASRP